MKPESINKQLITLKLFVDDLHNYVDKINNMIFTLESEIIDQQEELWFEKFKEKANIIF